MMIKLFYIAAGGALGTLSRYWLSGLMHRTAGSQFPWGTLTVNLVGALLIGVAWGLSQRISLPSNIKVMLFIGIFGGFTTFSTFVFEGMTLLKDDNIKLALLYIGISNLAGIILVYGGYMLSVLIIESIK